jgi:hypothetical protein
MDDAACSKNAKNGWTTCKRCCLPPVWKILLRRQTRERQGCHAPDHLVWLSYWRDVLLRVAGAETPLVNIDRNMEIEFLAGRLDLSTARKVVSELESALEKMDRNVNSKLLAEVLLLDLPKNVRCFEKGA